MRVWLLFINGKKIAAIAETIITKKQDRIPDTNNFTKSDLGSLCLSFLYIYIPNKITGRIAITNNISFIDYPPILILV